MASERDVNVAGQSEQHDRRQAWVRPAVERIEAGSAEGGSTNVVDVGVSYS